MEEEQPAAPAPPPPPPPSNQQQSGSGGGGSRRKSSTWKNFNLKRQLSRVDIKIKNSLKDKRNSIFYPEVSPTSEEIASRLEEVAAAAAAAAIASPDSDENTLIGGGDDQQFNNNRTDDDELQFSPDEEILTPPFTVGSLTDGGNKRVGFANRPDNLDLLDDDGSPVRPPRGRKKVQEKRDNRLLSVPNIKYHNRGTSDMQFLKDLRDKEEIIVSPQPSFTGNLMRRLSKLLQKIVFGS